MIDSVVFPSYIIIHHSPTKEQKQGEEGVKRNKNQKVVPFLIFTQDQHAPLPFHLRSECWAEILRAVHTHFLLHGQDRGTSI